MSHDASKLVGRWTTDPQDVQAIQEYGQVSLVFAEDGSLRYIIHAKDKDQIMVLSYRLEDGMIITNQPSEQREERTSFMLTPDGKLVLKHGDTQSSYIRSDEIRL